MREKDYTYHFLCIGLSLRFFSNRLPWKDTIGEFTRNLMSIVI